ncbi:MAG: exo-alpha-sialidase [Candidatus Schekmanbacteria bacterium]|nr:exo-alpha-sialidase [Candidatus Schekmanbacteria bacterium]
MFSKTVIWICRPTLIAISLAALVGACDDSSGNGKLGLRGDPARLHDTINPAASQLMSGLAASGSAVLASFVDNRSSSSRLYTALSRDGGHNFAAEVPVTADGLEATGGSPARAADGSWLVAYQTCPPHECPKAKTDHVAYSVDATTWREATGIAQMNPACTTMLEPRLVSSSSNRVFLVRAKKEASSCDQVLSVATSLDGGQTFGADVEIARPAPNSDIVDFAAAENGNGGVTVVWSNKRWRDPDRWDAVFKVFSAHSTDGGASFGPPVRVDDRGEEPHVQDLLDGLSVGHRTGGSEILVCWSDERVDPDAYSGDFYCARSADGGASYSADRQVSTPDQQVGAGDRSTVSASDRGELLVAWHQRVSPDHFVLHGALSTDGGLQLRPLGAMQTVSAIENSAPAVAATESGWVFGYNRTKPCMESETFRGADATVSVVGADFIFGPDVPVASYQQLEQDVLDHSVPIPSFDADGTPIAYFQVGLLGRVHRSRPTRDLAAWQPTNLFLGGDCGNGEVIVATQALGDKRELIVTRQGRNYWSNPPALYAYRTTDGWVSHTMLELGAGSDPLGARLSNGDILLASCPEGNCHHGGIQFRRVPADGSAATLLSTLDPGGYFAVPRELAVFEKGGPLTILLAYQQGLEIFFSQSTDGGSSFGAGVPIFAAGSLYRLATDGGNGLFALAREDEGSLSAVQSLDGGQSFVPADVTALNGELIAEISEIVVRDGRFLVAVTRGILGSYGLIDPAGIDLWSLDHIGGRWEIVEKIALEQRTSTCGGSSIGVGKDGLLFLTWVQPSGDALNAMCEAMGALFDQ